MPNRLAHEGSPYLQQHADNPVDWYPWGPEALERARAEDRPILLSVGYSACHWCHVMERESFADPGTAQLMNGAFVNIKVDREERPDVDATYMRAVQALTGRGGWPLTAFLTPDGRPFYGGTYFPPEPRHGLPSFRQLLRAVAEAWRDRRDEVRRNGEQLLAAIERSSREAEPRSGSVDGETTPGAGLALHAFRHLASRFDPAHGGFGGAPKFPQPLTLEFLLAHGASAGEPRAVEMVVHTLRQMAGGGVRDHLAGGFHRYSVDDRWQVPHFEKMLYDNALLARVYLDTFRRTGQAWLREVCTETLDYVLSDLRDPAGGFYAARDADSEGEEGRYYLWTPDEVESAAEAAACDPASVRLFLRLHGVSPGGNFEGRNILHLPHPPEAVARGEGISLDEFRERMEPVRQALLGVRARREPPFRDEKVICSWTAFTVRALAEAGAALERRDFLQAAVDGGEFLFRHMMDGEGLLRIWNRGEARIHGFLEDWAAVGNACLSLHEATLDPSWLHQAKWVGEEILRRFWDGDEGILYDAPEGAADLVVRARDLMDNATPSGNSLGVELFFRGGPLLGAAHWVEAAERILRREAGALERFPSAFGRMLTQVVRVSTPGVEVVILGPVSDPRTGALLGRVHRDHHPNRVVAGGDPEADELPDSPLLQGRGVVDGKPTAWVCRDFACRSPVTTPEELTAALAAMA